MDEPGALSDDALSDVAYLARSPNRVRILAALTREAYPRRELGEATGTSRTTLGRILSEFEERGWAGRTVDGEYAATPRGEHVAREFGPLVRAMDTIRSLGDAVAWLPTDELSIGLHHFADATVVQTEPNEPVELDRQLADLIDDASSLYTFTFLAPPQSVATAMYDGVSDGRLTAEHVLAGGLVDFLQDRSDRPPTWDEYVEAGARVYNFDGHIPCNLFVVDETVLILNDRPRGDGALESENEVVREWALELIGRYREEAERVDADAFA